MTGTTIQDFEEFGRADEYTRLGIMLLVPGAVTELLKYSPVESFEDEECQWIVGALEEIGEPARKDERRYIYELAKALDAKFVGHSSCWTLLGPENVFKYMHHVDSKWDDLLKRLQAGVTCQA